MPSRESESVSPVEAPAASAASAPSALRRLGKREKRLEWQNYVVYVFFVVVFVFFAATIGQVGFLSTANMFTISRSTAMIIVMSVAMVYVVAAGEIDLSVGSTCALASYIAAICMQAGWAWVAGVILALAAGAAVGLLNGVLVTVVGIPSFLVTLGVMIFVRGVDMWITFTHPVSVSNDTFNRIFGYANFGPVPSLLVWSIVVTVITGFVFHWSKFGRMVMATGGNRVAAAYSGIRTNRVVLLAFVLNSVAAALAGLLYTGMMRTARYTFGDGAELSVLAAVFIGGTSIRGGSGSILGAMVGALLIGMINNGIIIAGLDISQQKMVAGAIIVLAVSFGAKERA
jgi:ribose transport system permease protein